MNLRLSDLTFVIGCHKTGKTKRLSELFTGELGTAGAIWVRDDGMVLTKGCDLSAMIDSHDYLEVWDKWENAIGCQSRAYQVIEPVLRAGYSLSEGKTLILEHPDAHLDRLARVDLTNFLCHLVDSGKKVIIETHNELCFLRARVLVHYGRLKPEQVAINYTTHERVYYPKIDMDGRVKDWPSGFLEEIDEQLGELL